MNKLKSWKMTAVTLLLALAVVSMAFLSPILSSPEFYPETMEVIDNQKMDAMTMSIVLTAASTAISTLPDDTASSIADELDDLSAPLFLIVCILYMEKFLLTTLAWVSCSFLLPGCCLMGILYTCFGKEVFFVWARKLLILSVAMILIVPASAGVTARIEDTFSESVSQTIEKAYHLADQTETTEGKDNAFVAFFTGLKDNIASLVETAKNMLSVMVDAVAVLVVTSCVIPILTALLFVWVIKVIINVNIPVKTLALFIFPKKKRRSLSPDEREELPV